MKARKSATPAAVALATAPGHKVGVRYTPQQIARARRLLERGAQRLTHEELVQRCAFMAAMLLSLDDRTALHLLAIDELDSDLRSRRNKSASKGRLSKRNPKQHYAKIGALKLYLECAKGRHPLIKRFSNFFHEVDNRFPGVIRDKDTLRGWLKAWREEMVHAGEPVPQFHKVRRQETVSQD